MTAMTLIPLPASAAGLACGQKITRDTTLTGDLHCLSSSGLVIGADNITLDLAGHTISGSSNTRHQHVGVVISRYSGVTIRRGTISGFDTGIAPTKLQPGPGDRFLGLTTVSVGYGIAAGPDAFIIFDHTTTTGAGLAGIATMGNDDTVVNNTTDLINSNGDGDHIEHNNVGDIVFAGNNVVIAHNNLTGIIVDAEFAAWQHERISDNTAHSIQLHGVSKSVVAHNTLTGGGGGTCGSPFSSWLCNGIDVREGVQNFPPGTVTVFPANDNVLLENRVTRANDDGIYVEGAFSYPLSAGARTPVIVSGPGAITTVLWHNTASHNGIDGIGNNAPSTLFFRNIANNNASLGIDSVSGATDLGGNRASHNGDPAQCVGVVCSP